MEVFNKIKKYAEVRNAFGLLAVGLLLVICCGIILTRPAKEEREVSATILEILTEGTGENETHSVRISYEIDGILYETELGAYESGWAVGDVIECTYDPADPSIVNYGNGTLVVLIVLTAGVTALVLGALSLTAALKKSSSEYAQYQKTVYSPEERAKVEENEETCQDYVFHFTGKMNQSFIMENEDGMPVYEAVCGGVTLVKDTDFDFRNLLTGESQSKKIGHTITSSVGSGSDASINVSSAFKIDRVNCWDVLAEMGYGFSFSLKGLKCHYEITRYGAYIGYAETAGTEVLNAKYENNPLGKIPTNGIFRISCKPSEIEGVFLICFCLSKTEMTIS